MSAFPVYSVDKRTTHSYIKRYKRYNLFTSIIFIALYLVLNTFVHSLNTYVLVSILLTLLIVLVILFLLYKKYLNQIREIGELRMSKEEMSIILLNEGQTINSWDISRIATTKIKHPFKTDDYSFYALELFTTDNKPHHFFIKKDSADHRFAFIKALEIFCKLNKISLSVSK